MVAFPGAVWLSQFPKVDGLVSFPKLMVWSISFSLRFVFFLELATSFLVHRFSSAINPDLPPSLAELPLDASQVFYYGSSQVSDAS